jgi:hypothetical protein
VLSRTFQKLLFGVAFFLPLLAFANQYPDEAKSTRTTVTVHIVWLPNFEAVHAICSFYLPHLQGIVGCYNPITSTIYAVEPTNFNDHLRLEILGHEFWHALGAQHP